MSMNTGLLSELIIFTAGAIVGSAVTYVLVKRKYDSVGFVEEGCAEKEPEPTEKTGSPKSTLSKKEETERDMIQYNKIVKDYSGKEEEKNVDEPYMITAEDFAELDDYNTVSLYYYADGVLADEDDNIIDDIEDTVGEAALGRMFDDVHIDSLYVRNDVRKTDYEILRDLDNFSDKYRTEV